jgi:hypothetical protein
MPDPKELSIVLPESDFLIPGSVTFGISPQGDIATALNAGPHQGFRKCNAIRADCFITIGNWTPLFPIQPIRTCMSEQEPYFVQPYCLHFGLA